MLPPSVITRLSDYFGRYVIDVRCRVCAHARKLTPQALADIVGWDAPLSDVSARLRCSKCRAKDLSVLVGFDQQPRRWNKNPS
jgi:hypothetical protein